MKASFFLKEKLSTYEIEKHMTRLLPIIGDRTHSNEKWNGFPNDLFDPWFIFSFPLESSEQ